MNDEKPIRLRPRRPKQQGPSESKTWANAFKRLIHFVRMTSRPSTGSSRGEKGRSTRPSYRQRCAVRITYSGNRVKGQWAAHGRYISRDSATQSPESGFDAYGEAVDVPTRLRSWQSSGDPRLFKLIVSPEFGGRIDLTRLVRDIMHRAEVELGRKLEWAAVSHFNTEHPHAHVVLRGIADGKELRLDREFVKRGIRKHAEEACTEQLGFRTQADALSAEEKEVDQPRLTSLDRQIARHRPPSSVGSFDMALNRGIRQNVVRRLFRLQTLGLAESTAEGKWTVRSDFEAVLRTMQTVTDRQRMVAAHAELLSDPRLPIQYTPTKDISQLSGRVIAHTQDDASGNTLMILEGTDHRIHIIPHDTTIERERQHGRMKPGNFVSLRRNENCLRTEDHGSSQLYLNSMKDSTCQGRSKNRPPGRRKRSPGSGLESGQE